MSKDNELSLYSNFNQIGGDYKNARKEYIKEKKKHKNIWIMKQKMKKMN